MSKAFGEQNPTQGEDPVSWQTWSDGAAGTPEVVGNVDWGKLKLPFNPATEGRSAVYDLGAAATRTFTLTENRYGTGTEDAVIQIRGDTSSFLQDDVTPAWETYTTPVSKGYRYVQVRAITEVDWWLSGGIAAANCIAAYQPKGAASYAASKVNLANPGTYDLSDGAAYPTWDAVNGWRVIRASSQYLVVNSAIITDYPVTMAAMQKHTQQTATGSKLIMITKSDYSSYMALRSSGDYPGRFDAVVPGGTAEAPSQSDFNVWTTTVGVFSANNSRKAYYNGSGGVENYVTHNLSGLDTTYIGRGDVYADAYYGAVAFYNIALSDAQVLALHNAMMAL